MNSDANSNLSLQIDGEHVTVCFLLIFSLTFSCVCVLCANKFPENTQGPVLCLITDISWKSSVSTLLFFINNDGSNECVI